MKRFLIAMLLGYLWTFPSAESAFAQDPYYSQYYLNLPGINPGFTGAEDYLDLKLGFRQGWNDFGVRNDNFFVSAYGTMGASRGLSLKRSVPRMSQVQTYASPQFTKKIRRRHGIGTMMTNRNVGPYLASALAINYAYHLPISEKLMVSLGTKIGYHSQRVDFTGYTVRDPINDVFYQQLMRVDQGNQNSLMIDFGSVIYSNRFYLGLSSSNLVVRNLNGNSQLNFGNQRQYLLVSGYNLNLGQDVALNSGLRLIETREYGLNWSLNSRLQYKHMVYLGSAYDNVNKISILLGLSLKGRFNFNYSYDHYLSNKGSLNMSVHEIVLGVPLINKFGSDSRFW